MPPLNNRRRRRASTTAAAAGPSKRRRVSPPTLSSPDQPAANPPARRLRTPSSQTAVHPARTPPPVTAPDEQTSSPHHHTTATIPAAVPVATASALATPEQDAQRMSKSEASCTMGRAGFRLELVHRPVDGVLSAREIRDELATLRRRVGRRYGVNGSQREVGVLERVRREVGKIRDGVSAVDGVWVSEGEGVVRDGLKECVELLQAHWEGVAEFVQCGGVEAVVELLGRGLGAGQGWEVRAMCLRLLLMAVGGGEGDAAGGLERMAGWGGGGREGGAVGLLVELLEEVGRGVLDRAGVGGGVGGRRRGQVGAEEEGAGKWEMVGRVCAVLTAVARQSEKDEAFMRRSMPRKVYLALGSLACGWEGRGGGDVYDRLSREFERSADKLWAWRWGW